MYRNPAFPQIFLIAEIHPQFSGDMAQAQTMILQCKLGGADAVKVQLYDSQALFGNQDRDYVQLSKNDLREMKQYCNEIGIELFASIFTTDRIDWCEELGFPYYKIASRTVKETDLCERILGTGKPVFISLGAWDWRKRGIPYQYENAIYFYCVAKYPTPIEEVAMPQFGEGIFQGYSDHTIGLGAAAYALARGATYVEKHFTLNKSLHFPTELGHAGAMDLDDLRTLRNFADTFSLLHQAAEAKEET